LANKPWKGQKTKARNWRCK